MKTEFIRVDTNLVRDIVKVTKIPIKSKAVRKAIEEFLMAQKRKGLKKLAGKLRFYTQHDLTRMRRDDF